MKIAVNTRFLLHNKLEGIGWFTYETLKRVVLAHPEHEFIFLFDRPYHKNFVFADNVTPVVIGPPARHPFLWYLWFELSVPRALKKYKADVFLSPDGYASLKADIRTVIVMHDINFVHRPEDVPMLTRKYYNHYFPKFAHKADWIATVSDFSKRDICNNFYVDANDVDVVYNGANPIYQPIPEAEQQQVREQYTDGDPYFIFVGALHPRKNIARLLKAFDYYKKNATEGLAAQMKLIVVGDVMFKAKGMEQTYNKMVHKADVIFTGRLNPDRLHRVMASAFCLTFVPYFEGFGIPIIEAMNCDVPVITSNVTSMPEVAGNAALLVDPFDVMAIATAMGRICAEPGLHDALVQKGRRQRQRFSWEKTAESLWQTVEKCL